MKYKKNLQVIAKMVQTLIVEVSASSLAPHRKKKVINRIYSTALGWAFPLFGKETNQKNKIKTVGFNGQSFPQRRTSL